ncbi:MAG: zinc ABC transporter substrate-binding protein [Bacteroidales bacterium]|nr:zinc ABC transporter substrate-binding protein [Bacteroidales bacterium]
MKKKLIWLVFTAFVVSSCGTPGGRSGERTITVSIPPFRYFVEAVADTDFVVNVMLPPGADHHSWEPLPKQITALAGSEAFVINGKLGFELAWMRRFREVNPTMKIADLSQVIELIEPVGEEGHEGHGREGADPHYWLSPKEAYKIAAAVRDLVTELNPAGADRYAVNYDELIAEIARADSIVSSLLRGAPSKTFMIFHPALTYMARDYGLEQISFEDEGKSPSPARMKELVDLSRERGIKIIFIQAEYDLKGAQVLAEETGATLVIIDPMNPEWGKAVVDIAKELRIKN